MEQDRGRIVRWRSRAIPLVSLLAICIVGAGCGGESPTPSDSRLQEVVDGLTRDLFVGNGLTGQRQLFHLPGSSLTVETPDGDARTFVSGMADVAEDAPVSAGMVQPVGSNTKVVTAVLVMQLVEAGKLDVNDRVLAVASRFRRDGGALERLARRYRGRLRDVELRELLDHTSGLADCLDSPGFFKAFERHPLARYRLAELAGFGLSQPPVFKPGAPGQWNYSNTDYMLLGMVIEAVTGSPLARRWANCSTGPTWTTPTTRRGSPRWPARPSPAS